jgi:hypothetical protein
MEKKVTPSYEALKKKFGLGKEEKKEKQETELENKKGETKEEKLKRLAGSKIEKELNKEDLQKAKQEFLSKASGLVWDGKLEKTWKQMTKDAPIPLTARSFIYPEQYRWGRDRNDQFIDKTLADYTPEERAIREALLGSFE